MCIVCRIVSGFPRLTLSEYDQYQTETTPASDTSAARDVLLLATSTAAIIATIILLLLYVTPAIVPNTASAVIATYTAAAVIATYTARRESTCK